MQNYLLMDFIFTGRQCADIGCYRWICWFGHGHHVTITQKCKQLNSVHQHAIIDLKEANIVCILLMYIFLILHMHRHRASLYLLSAQYCRQCLSRWRYFCFGQCKCNVSVIKCDVLVIVSYVVKEFVSEIFSIYQYQCLISCFIEHGEIIDRLCLLFADKMVLVHSLFCPVMWWMSTEICSNNIRTV